MLRERFENFLTEHGLVTRGDHILVGTSGGVDSMVLLVLLAEAQTKLGFRVSALHANHQLREEESEQDEQFVRAFCEARGIPCIVSRLDVQDRAERQHESIQLAAREMRYLFFEETRKSSNATSIATAHHADDNAETVLMNIVRGTGLRGLAGIPVRRKDASIIRPLLWARRREIEHFAATERIPFRTDSSNSNAKYQRNEIRLSVLPKLQAHAKIDVIEALNEVARSIRDVVDVLDARTEHWLRQFVRFGGTAEATLRTKELELLDPLLKEHVLLAICRRLDIEPSEERISAISALTYRQTGKKLELPTGWRAFRERDAISFQRKMTETSAPVLLRTSGTFERNGYQVAVTSEDGVPNPLSREKNVACIDAEQIESELVLRDWQSGDWFIPLGFRHRKKLSDFFIDQKVPAHVKHSIPVVACGDRIVWVCGMRIDDRFKIVPGTRRTMTFTLRPNQITQTP